MGIWPADARAFRSPAFCQCNRGQAVIVVAASTAIWHTSRPLRCDRPHWRRLEPFETRSGTHSFYQPQGAGGGFDNTMFGGARGMAHLLSVRPGNYRIWSLPRTGRGSLRVASAEVYQISVPKPDAEVLLEVRAYPGR